MRRWLGTIRSSLRFEKSSLICAPLSAPPSSRRIHLCRRISHWHWAQPRRRRARGSANGWSASGASGKHCRCKRSVRRRSCRHYGGAPYVSVAYTSMRASLRLSPIRAATAAVAAAEYHSRRPQPPGSRCSKCLSSRAGGPSLRASALSCCARWRDTSLPTRRPRMRPIAAQRSPTCSDPWSTPRSMRESCCTRVRPRYASCCGSRARRRWPSTRHCSLES